MGITRSGDNLEMALVDSEDGDIESTTSEIVDEDVGVLCFLVESVGDSGGGGLIDDSEHIESGDLAGVLGGLSLGVVEVSGDGYNGVLDFHAQKVF